MGAPPPPYPPPYSGQPQPPFNWRTQRDAMKAQARAAKFQMRAQRQQWRAQQDLLRRRSIAGPLLLIVAGIVFLMVEMGHGEWYQIAESMAHWWPLLLIGVGCVLIAEWMYDQQHPVQYINGTPVYARRRLGGVVWLLVLLALAGLAVHGSVRLANNVNLGFFDHEDVMRAIGQAHDSDDSMSLPIAANGTLLLNDPHGNVTLSGTSVDGQVHVTLHRHIYTLSERDAQTKFAQLQPRVSNSDGHISLSIPSVDAAEVDLDVEAPPTVMISVNADNGDIDVHQVQNAVNVTAARGDVSLSDIHGAATVHMHHDDSSFAAKSVAGDINFDGRCGDVNLTDISGDVMLHGDFFGTTDIQHIGGSLHFMTSRTEFQTAHLYGEFNIDDDSLDAQQLIGPVTLKTHDKNVTMDRVQGPLAIENRDGRVNVTSTSPVATITISNHDGSVDFGVPDGSNFTLHAATRDGSVENDFGLIPQKNDDSSTVNGPIGRGGPVVSIDTGEGTVTVRKVAVLPLAPVAPPAPPAPTPATAAHAPAAPASHTAHQTAPPAAPAAPATGNNF